MAAGQTTAPELQGINGRPFLFTKPEDLRMRIQGYFDECDPHVVTRKVENGYKENGQVIWADRERMTKPKVYTVTGLARHLKVSRETIRNYRLYKHYSDNIDPEIRQELIDTIEDAYMKIEEFNESQLHKSGISNGVKFNLTNNFNWQDVKVVETNTVEDDLDNLDDPKAEEQKSLSEEAEAALAETPPPVTAGADNLE